MATVTAVPQTEERLVETAAFVESSRDDTLQKVDVDLIVEGFGNQRDGHYYSGDLLEREVAKFSAGSDGVQMYSNHLTAAQERQLEGQPRPWQDLVGRILPGTARLAVRESDGRRVVRGTALISNPLAWAYVQADPQILKVSINARGVSRLGEAEGRSAKLVESINTVKSVDVVSLAGAGGGNMKINRMAEAYAAFQEAAADAIEEDAAVSTPAAAETTSEEPQATAATDEATETTATEGDGACAECGEKHDGACRESAADAEETSDKADDTATGGAGEPSPGEPTSANDTDDVQEGEWESTGEDLEEGDVDAEGEGELEEGRGRRGGRRSAEIRSGRDRTPVAAEFGWPGDEDTAADEIDGIVHGNDASPHERMSRANGGRASARALAANIEAEIERRVGARLDQALSEAQDSFQEELDRLAEEHARALEQVHQRYLAREQIRESALPDATKAALVTEFHDFFAEALTEGDVVVKAQRQMLREAVARRIDEKGAEVREFAGPMVEAGASAGSEDPSAATPAKGADGERPKRAPLDEKIDAELGIE